MCDLISHHFSFVPPSCAAPRALPSICSLALSCKGDGCAQMGAQTLHCVLQYWNAHHWNRRAWKHLSKLLTSPLYICAGIYRHKRHLYLLLMNKWSQFMQKHTLLHAYRGLQVWISLHHQHASKVWSKYEFTSESGPWHLTCMTKPEVEHQLLRLDPNVKEFRIRNADKRETSSTSEQTPISFLETL